MCSAKSTSARCCPFRTPPRPVSRAPRSPAWKRPGEAVGPLSREAVDGRPSVQGRPLLLAPLVTEGRVVGALGVASDRVAGFSDEEAVLLQRIGTAVAGAADRARLRVSERERRGWLTFVAETGDLLAGSLDQDMTMAITGQGSAKIG